MVVIASVSCLWDITRTPTLFFSDSLTVITPLIPALNLPRSVENDFAGGATRALQGQGKAESNKEKLVHVDLPLSFFSNFEGSQKVRKIKGKPARKKDLPKECSREEKEQEEEKLKEKEKEKEKERKRERENQPNLTMALRLHET